MPRGRRFIPPNEAALHITTRGNNRNYLFANDEDKIYYLHALKQLKEENKIDIFHYCLMDNHAHMVAWLRAGHTLSKCIKQLNLKYFNYYKKTYGYTGCLWQRRFKSNLIDTDTYLLQCGKYIELNPVRAGIISLPEKYRFSSYGYYACGKPDMLITPNPAYIDLSLFEKKRRELYIKFVIDHSIINSRSLQAQLFIGSESFVRDLEECHKIKNTGLKRGRPKKTEK
ncbi:MAG: transposase [Candidatus Omnitrophota bacterium]|jgi:putative transposase